MTAMGETATRDCRRNAWLVALAGGALVALMLLLLAQFGVLKALMLGAVAGVLLGIFLVWAFCSQGAPEGVPQSEPLPAAEPAATLPAGHPVEPAAEPMAGSGSKQIVFPAPESASDRRPEPTPAAPAAAPPAFVSAQSAGRSESATEAAAPAGTASAAPARGMAAPRKVRPAGGLDAALAKSRNEPAVPAAGMLGAPRGGKADDLKLIRGVGPKLEVLLNEVGVWHFDQIAAWKAKDIAHVDERLVGFHGRITRDKWVKQAKALAAGGATRRGAHRGEE